MASFYRVVGEAVTDGRRTYLLRPVNGLGGELTRTCDSELAPLTIGTAYSMAEIEQRCPDPEPFYSGESRAIRSAD